MKQLLAVLIILTGSIASSLAQEVQYTTQRCFFDTPHFPNVKNVVIPAQDSPLGRINQLFIQFNIKRGIPFASTAVLNSLNQKKEVDRQNKFRRSPCLQEYQTECSKSYKMTDDQQKVAKGSKSFDRGHLTPSSPFLYSKEANLNTFVCLNMAPQDPFTNQKPWQKLEHKIQPFFGDRAGYVITGVCDEDSVYSPTKEGYIVPDCYWKLVCYKDTEGDVQVVGFIGNNTITPKGDGVEMEERIKGTHQPRTQAELLETVVKQDNVALVRAAWEGAESYLLENRKDIVSIPTADECVKVKGRKLTKRVVQDWVD